ncbi:spore protease YyaC [Shouchella shacheensis]|uniref:spore protease YyaC n=1 Tax=Shouchella shacheensis TaxID=1649580 RepID=UPI000740193E|nr:spore protease YyaC [Shouchella shacheensis]
MSTNLWPFRKKPRSIRVHMDDIRVEGELAEALLAQCETRGSRELVLICVGTDRSTGDALGPLVGTKLATESLSMFHVYGTLAAPVHAANMEERLAEISAKHPNAYVVAVDACLGRSPNVGCLTLSEDSLKPGAAMGKSLPTIGDVSLTAIVNVGGMMDFYTLQNTRLYTVMTMAEKLANVIRTVDELLVKRQARRAFFSLPTTEMRRRVAQKREFWKT